MNLPMISNVAYGSMGKEGSERDLRASIRALDLTSTEAILAISSAVYVEYLKVTMERESPISAITSISIISFLKK